MKLSNRAVRWRNTGLIQGRTDASLGELPGHAPLHHLPHGFPETREGQLCLTLYQDAYFTAYLTQATGVSVSDYWKAKEIST